LQHNRRHGSKKGENSSRPETQECEETNSEEESYNHQGITDA
jgi:hypothetical protein